VAPQSPTTSRYVSASLNAYQMPCHRRSPQTTSAEIAAAAADVAQAAYFRDLFQGRPEAVRRDVAENVRRLTRTMTVSEAGSELFVTRRAIRTGEHELPTIDRMLEQSNGRFVT
jgi:hypothetical protein